MSKTLLEQCNFDVFAAILEIKEKKPPIGEKLTSILQSHTSVFDMTLGEMLWFSAHLPEGFWNFKIHTFYLLFQFKHITTMSQL
jgi:hypothetical protein